MKVKKLNSYFTNAFFCFPKHHLNQPKNPLQFNTIQIEENIMTSKFYDRIRTRKTEGEIQEDFNKELEKHNKETGIPKTTIIEKALTMYFESFLSMPFSLQ